MRHPATALGKIPGFFFLLFLLLSLKGFGQINTGLNGTVINLPCGVNCTSLKVQVPHLKSTEDYSVVSISYNPYPYVTSAPGLVYTSCINEQDDKFFDTSFLPFNFCFYGAYYSKMVMSTNALITFDTTNALRGSHWALSATSTLPGAGPGSPTAPGLSCPTPSLSALLPRAAIFGVYQDIDITKSSPNKKMEYRVEGTSPLRRIVVSFFEIPHYLNTNCPELQTSQIVMHENTGLIEVYVGNRTACNSHNAGRAILGIQNWNRDKAVTPPGKNSTAWTESNTGYRFVPSGVTSRFSKAEIWDMSGTLLYTTTAADTTTTVPGLLDINFSNICPAASSQYVVKTYFSSCETGTPLESIDTITVNKTTTLNATHTTTPSACGPSGSITVNIPSGVGVAPFRASLNGGTPQVMTGLSHTFSGLLGGSHTVVVTDNSVCSQTINVTVASSGTLNVNHTATPTSCAGASDGSITLQALNGTAPFQYNINSGPFQSSPVFTGLAPGTYFFSIKDASGCVTNNYQGSVGQGAGITAPYVVTPPTCGSANGTITFQPTGTPPFTYSVNGGPFQTGTVISGLLPNTYFISIKDASGCRIDNLQVVVPASTPFQANLTPTPPACNGLNNGSIQISPLNGTAPFSYSLNGGAFQSALTIPNLAPGTYSVVVKEGGGCASLPYNVTVPQGPFLQVTTSATAANCAGVGGAISVQPAGGGQAPYTYQLDGGSFQPFNVFTNVTSGVHTVVMKDNLGCTSQPQQVTVPTGTPLTTTLVVTPTSCNGASNGTITALPPGPLTIVYEYSINGGPFQNYNVFSGLPAGTYQIVVRDAGGCQSNPIPAVVLPGPGLTLNHTLVQVSCNGANNGSVTIQAPANGTAPFQYSLDGGAFGTSNAFTNLAPGNHTVSLRDNSGCTAQASFTISEPPVLAASVNKQAVLCRGQANGTITVTAGGGASPYQYSLDGVSYQPSNSFQVAAGTYTIYVKDNNGCIKQLPAEAVTEPAALSVSASALAAGCAGTGQLTATATGGTAPYEYSAGPGGFQASNLFNLPAGNYTINVRDAKGCLSQASATVALTNDLTLTPSADAEICEGSSVQLQAQSNATQFSWQAIPGLSTYTGASTTASPVVTTDYIVTATLGSCSVNDTITVLVNPAPIADAGPDQEICFGQSATLKASGGVQYEWNMPGNAADPAPVVSPDKTTEYLLYVTDARGCRSLQADRVRVTVTPPIVVSITPDTAVAAGDQFRLRASSLADNYLWTPAIGLDDPTDPNPLVTVTSDISYRVVASTDAGCRGEALVRLKVYKGPELYVPTAFTPNGDGKNDRFFPFPVGIVKLNYFKVFNRWGQQVYTSNTLNEGWDGMTDGKAQPTGTYVWMAEGVTKDNKVITRRGTVTLIR